MAINTKWNAGLSAIAVLLVLGSAAAFAQRADDAANFPSRPIRIVVGFTPGGQPDIYARLIAVKLTESLHQQVVVDNRPGAGGVIGTQIVVNANPDGYTLLSVSSAHVTSPAVHAKLPYDTEKDLAGIT
ncbi:MAG TPA: tripartite tricarboxylate transporter substrate-binding protein, partial [Burkholderiales bacterium]|nr:tripartite tricarboxylate transporter substrate-binding protein [Burkholderiales bacterium]